MQVTIMFEHQIKFRVLYSDTDRMGYMYHGQYPKYLEMGRVEALRSLGLSYKSMEDSGVMMPVLELNIKYVKPIYYDDKITLKTKVHEIPKTRIFFNYELYNENGKLTTIAKTILVFVDCISKKPCLIPDNFKSSINSFYK